MDEEPQSYTALFQMLYSEVKFKVATSAQHLDCIKKQKKTKKKHISYMSYLDTIFPLDVILDAEYWRYHKLHIKHAVIE